MKAWIIIKSTDDCCCSSSVVSVHLTEESADRAERVLDEAGEHCWQIEMEVSE